MVGESIERRKKVKQSAQNFIVMLMKPGKRNSFQLICALVLFLLAAAFSSCSGSAKPAAPAPRDSVFLFWEAEKKDPCKDFKPPATDCGFGYMLLRKNNEALCTFVCQGSDTENVHIGKYQPIGETLAIQFDRSLEYDPNDMPGKKMRGENPFLIEWKPSGCRPDHFLFRLAGQDYRAIRANDVQNKYFINELRLLQLIHH